MTSEEFTAARERLRLTSADVSAEFGLTPDVVDAIEAGSVKVTRHMAKQAHPALLAAAAIATVAASHGGLAAVRWRRISRGAGTAREGDGAPA